MNFSQQKYTALGFLLIGLVGGYVVGQAKTVGLLNSINNSLTPIEEKGTKYSFVHPLLAYRVPEATTFGDYLPLKNALEATIDSEISMGRAAKVSLYFRDLQAARWVGIAQDDTFYPASLLKVPTMIAYLKQVETNPSILNQNITYDAKVLPADPFGLSSTLISSRPYSVQELISRMIIDSDNGATFTLLDKINPEFLRQVYIALGIQDPGDDSANYKISARTYGLFFRVLYNATYLSPLHSEQALTLLSQTTYTGGLVAGMPKGTVVAHKYGEHVFSQNGSPTGLELSDCGIVYYPAHPYLLCVMTSAQEESYANNVIAKISKTVYDAVAERYPITVSSK